MTNAFQDKVVLVTGGSTGIGAAIALQLANAGAKVLVTGRNEATLKSSAARHANLAYVPETSETKKRELPALGKITPTIAPSSAGVFIGISGTTF